MQRELSTTWKNPYLVQRLEALQSYKDSNLPKDFSPVTKETTPEQFRELRQSIFSYSYMGSSEYEWGAIPKAIKEFLEKKDDYIAVTVKVKGGKPNYKQETKYHTTKGKRTAYKEWRKSYDHIPGSNESVTKDVFIYCHKDHVEQITQWLNDAVSGDYNKTRCKEQHYCEDAILCDEEVKLETYHRTIGGFDLDNHWWYLSHEPEISKFKMIMGIDK